MLIDVIRHQHARIADAMRALMSLTTPPGRRAAEAIAALSTAFEDTPPVWAQRYLATIHEIAGSGPGVEERVAHLTPEQLATLAAAVLELYTIACREYWTA